MKNKEALKLAGLNVVIFENRLAKTMADLVSLQGGIPFSAPAMKEVPIENNPEALSFGEKLLNGEIDILILLTGVGTRSLITILETRYDREKILAALKRITIVVRGPKPIKALQELDVPYAAAASEPNTWREILSVLDQRKSDIVLNGRTVAVQEYGVTNAGLLSGLEARGAHVMRVPVYRWALPDDLGPLRQAVSGLIGGEIEVAIFTTAVQVDHLFQVAREMAMEDKLKNVFKKVAVASVGPDNSEALRAHGVSVDIQPKSPKMGPLVAEVADQARNILTRKRETCEGFAVELRSAILELTGEDELRGSVFMKACRREKTPFTPVWLMRQAGRYMKDYRLIREKTPFLEICKNKDLVTEITVTAQQKINADAAIIFSDILLVVEAFGLGLEYTKGDGPAIHRPIRDKKDIETLPDIDPELSLGYVLAAIRQTRRALRSDIPLIGFAGAPFTLASYMIEGGASKDFSATKRMMLADGSLWKTLMEKIVFVTSKYLNSQINAGAQAVQLFDSWVGCLTAEEYEKFVLPYSRRLISGIVPAAPVIHFGTGTAYFLESFSQAGGDVISVDNRIALDEAWKRIGHTRAIQGNLDPQVLCSDIKNIKEHVIKILKAAAGRPGHIFNLGHGVLPQTPVENAVALVDMVHEMSAA